MNGELQTILEEIALKIVLVTPDDIPNLGEVLNLLDELSKKINDLDLKTVIEKMMSQMESIILGEGDVELLFGTVQEGVSALQQVLIEEKRLEEVCFPKDYVSNIHSSPQGQSQQLEMYLSVQRDHLQALETSILASGESDFSKTETIKKILHNIKGESGLMGYITVSEMCHHIEDALEKDFIKNEIFIKVKDILYRTVMSTEKREDPDALKELLGTIQPNTSQTLDVSKNIESDKIKEVVSAFIKSSTSHFKEIDACLLKIKENAQDSGAALELFRLVRAIKGISAFIGVTPIFELSRSTADLISHCQNRKKSISDEKLNLITRSVEVLKKMVSSLKWVEEENNLHCPEEDEHNLLDQFDFHMEGKAAVDKTEKEIPKENEANPKPETTQLPSPPARQKANLSSNEMVKVDLEKIDQLVEMIGELVISESMVFHEPELMASIRSSARLQRNVERLRLISRNLQDLAVVMRLVPLQATFQKMNRLVRDVSKKLNKKIYFISEGGDTELDRTIAEQIGDPLVHMLRNAVDHGIESKEKRLAAGKPEEGKVILSAYHKGGNIVIEIEDDGGGIPKDIILKKAIDKEIVSPDRQLSEKEIFGLLFSPGFSTAAKVTDVSGRGVGMDVVKTNIEKLGGHIDIDSELGKGTSFKIILPLTMAIIDGMLIRVGEERYFVPILPIVETIELDHSKINVIANQSKTIYIRGEVIPLVHLSDIFETEVRTGDTEMVMIIENSGKSIALVVNELLGQQQVVIKNLSPYLGKVEGISAATIMSDGSVGLIIDPVEIFKISV